MKKIFLLAVTIFLLAAGCQKPAANNSSGHATTTPPGGQVACTQDVMQCPDGTYVARVAPSCNFALCPTLNAGDGTPSKTGSGIEGTIKLGPTCPVQRVPEDPSCQDKPYISTVDVKTLGGRTVTSFSSNNFGAFKVDLPAGTYVLYPQMPTPLPRAPTQTVVVKANAYTAITIYYDTGIR